MKSKHLLLVCCVTCVILTEVCARHDRDYYDVLGIKRSSTQRQIKSAFRSLALKFHPDKNKAKNAEEKFREIAEGDSSRF